MHWMRGILREILYALGRKGITFNHVHDAFFTSLWGCRDFLFCCKRYLRKKKFFNVSLENAYFKPNCDQLEKFVTENVLKEVSSYKDTVLSRVYCYSNFDPRNCINSNSLFFYFNCLL